MSMSNLKSQISSLKSQTSNLRFRIVLLVSALALAQASSAGTLTGTVRNGTTGAVVAGQDVVLIQLQGGMETVASAKTDAQGRYALDHPSIGQAPVLIRVNYRGVNFHQNVPPGRAVADVEVFEPTTDPAAMELLSRSIIVQPNGPTLIVGEEYSIHNHSKPPKAYFKADGTFEFEIPAGAEIGQVAAWGPSGMPVGQGTIDKGKNRYAIAFPFRPGENGIRLAYQVPYPGNAAVVPAISGYAAKRVTIVAPPTVQIQAAGFSAAGTDQGWNIYQRDEVSPSAVLNISVSGTAPPMSANEAQSAGGSAAPASAASQLPGRLDSLKWPLIAGFGVLFGLGVIFLWRRPAASVAVAGDGTKPPKAAKAAQTVAEVHQQVGNSLDEIKETFFRLELRRQAGTISEEDYARERARAEKYIHDILKG